MMSNSVGNEKIFSNEKIFCGAYRIRTGDLYNANVARYQYIRIANEYSGNIVLMRYNGSIEYVGG